MVIFGTVGNPLWGKVVACIKDSDTLEEERGISNGKWVTF
jgi:hypothetical protein